MSDCVTFKSYWPRARKFYSCEWCSQTILRGEQHFHYVGKFEGDFQDWRMHEECEDAWQQAGAGEFESWGNARPEIQPTPRELREELESLGQLVLPEVCCAA